VRGEQQLRELADARAALRRRAMLVAPGEPPDAVLADRDQAGSPAFW